MHQQSNRRCFKHLGPPDQNTLPDYAFWCFHYRSIILVRHQSNWILERSEYDACISKVTELGPWPKKREVYTGTKVYTCNNSRSGRLVEVEVHALDGRQA